MNVGALAAGMAFILWGLMPLYLRLVPGVPPLEVLSNRIVWALAVLWVAMVWRGRWGWLRTAREPRVLAAFAASALLLSANWVTYIWAVGQGRIVESSLGYFMTPLVNVLLGYTVLREYPRRAQWVALAIASVGVVWMTVATGALPWIGLILAATFGVYGLLRKVAAIDALEGLTLETTLLAPFGIAGLWWWWGSGPTSFPSAGPAVTVWLLGLGPITAVPLLLFAVGARRLSMASLGMMQYLGPTLQFLVGVWIFDEPFGPDRLVGFGLIWIALAVYSADALRNARLTRRDVAEPATSAG
ncbi:EamA family transporter RarD [Piscinibacter koreensis]|uniref:EamA family transporter RarD n=1 Tax=Piscinibacter koreensis TaxID=2742824 RepID=A0A7Y6NQ24_9BURK|nr:EamA family transporter RarD [Schlegelella koreensis]NUZ07215.1 EamA family transporter RarD [Schlegelella koreensis]